MSSSDLIVITITINIEESSQNRHKKARIDSQSDLFSWDQTIEGVCDDKVTCFHCMESILVHQNVSRLKNHLLQCAPYRRLLSQSDAILPDSSVSVMTIGKKDLFNIFFR